jgi:hypothetical protein
MGADPAVQRVDAYQMSDIVIIGAVTTGVVVIMLFLLLRRRLTRVAVDLRQGRVDADMKREEPLPEGGARQRGIEATGNVTARDETGVGASQDNVKAGGDVEAIVTAPRGRGARKKT